MPTIVEPEQVIERLARKPQPRLIAVDGLPCSGKSTLADKIQDAFGFDCIYLDDFVRPESEWSALQSPAFPFDYIRYDEFVSAIQTLATTGECTYYSFDWEALATSASPRTVTLAQPVMIEGLSALNTILEPLYDLKIFIDSDRSTILEVALSRGVGLWADQWRNLFLPSADLYMETCPELRADLIVRGRGSSLRSEWD